jgi:hypothetical protein
MQDTSTLGPVLKRHIQGTELDYTMMPLFWTGPIFSSPCESDKESSILKWRKHRRNNVTDAIKVVASLASWALWY